ncbi:transglutaminaseTgpA domain-containing protein, partial [Actinophytocola sp.]|uniref:transglutaminase family protein n=1 Tax=Actinophytocola sp. TaxID=1872138 RepID=UPI003D6B68E7
MTSRGALVWVLLAAAGPGLLFAPVFGLPALLLPVGVVVLATFGSAELARLRPGLVPWRPLLALVLGSLGLAEALLWPTTMAGLPTGATVRALVAGVTDSWQLTLQSTWPARPDAELLLFVPLVVLGAAVLGVELLTRLRRPLVAVLPGLAVLVLSQAYVSLTGITAIAAGLGFALVTGALLVTTRLPDDKPATRRSAVTALMVVPTLVFAAAGAALAAALDPADRPAYSLRHNRPASVPTQRVGNPLDEVADRLLDPDEPVFSYTTTDPVDRWRLVVLADFNGVTWTPGADYRRMGAALSPAPAVTTDVGRRSARVHLGAADAAEEPWVPSQALPAEVGGVAPLVDETAGTLIVTDRPGPVDYELAWWEPRVDPDALYDAGIDPTARSGFGDLGVVPPAVADLAREAAHGSRPSFRTALLIEDFLSKNYRVATEDLPTGNGWPQIERFLLDTKRGTSEQFAAAYVVLARILGVPARIAVGYRAPEGSGRVEVRNENVLAWPEVAVAGVGWVPLDPSGAAESSGAVAGLAEVTAKARAKLPPPEELVEPDVPEDSDDPADATPESDFSVPLTGIALGVAVLVVGWLLGVPLAGAARAWHRRRRPGAR